jgi:beta-lactamase class A
MVEILRRQQFNDRLSAGLPKEVAFAHKTGQLDGIEHDAGIFCIDGQQIIVVALTEELPLNENGDLCCTMGQMVYTHYSALQLQDAR